MSLRLCIHHIYIHILLCLFKSIVDTRHKLEGVYFNGLFVILQAMDSECEWNQKNKHRPPEFTGDITYAKSTSQFVNILVFLCYHYEVKILSNILIKQLFHVANLRLSFCNMRIGLPYIDSCYTLLSLLTSFQSCFLFARILYNFTNF